MKRWASLTIAAVIVTSTAGIWGDSGASASPIPQPPELWVMDADGSDQRRVSPEPNGSSYVDSPAWSPDGSEIAYIAAGEVRIVTLSTGVTRTVASNVAASKIAWSPDGNWIAIATHSGTPRGLFLMRPDGSAMHHVGPDLQASYPRWSANSLRIAGTFVTTPGEPFQVAVVDLVGDHQVVARDASFTGTSWAPDGSRLAYTDSAGRLGVITIGGETTKITSGNDFAFGPEWSPDGTKIAYVENGVLVAINPDGSGRIELASPGGAPHWSPLSDALVFADRSDAGDIYRVGRDATGLTNLTNTSERFDHDPVWSPTGTSIAYLSEPKTPVPPDETITTAITLRIREHIVFRGRVDEIDGSSSVCSFHQRQVRIEQRRAWGWDVIARTRTEGSRGRFEAEIRDREGRFRAVVGELVTYGIGGNRVTCTAARSEVVRHRHS